MSMRLPAPEVRDLLADALHHAVSKLFDPSVQHVAPINTLGSYFLSHLFGRTYRPVAGSVVVTGGGTPFGFRAKPEDLEAHEYYVWIETETDNAEVVDFCARYWPDWAEGLGILWTGPRPPAVLWECRSEADAGPARYERHDAITAAVRGAVARAIADRSTGDTVETWEQAVNDAIDFLASSEAGLAFLESVGIAEAMDE